MADEYPADYCPCVDYPETCTKAGADYCCIHDRHEVASENDYRWCFECGHVYETGEDLLDAWLDAVSEWPTMAEPLPTADEIGFCQFCLHDW